MPTPLPYNDIAIGAELYGPDGQMVKVVDKHKPIDSDEERLVYVFLSNVKGTRYSVPHGFLGNNFYASPPSSDQILANEEEMKPDDHDSEYDDRDSEEDDSDSEDDVPDFIDPSTEEDNVEEDD